MVFLTSTVKFNTVVLKNSKKKRKLKALNHKKTKIFKRSVLLIKYRPFSFMSVRHALYNN